MADNYLETRYEQLFGRGSSGKPAAKRPSWPSLDSLLLRNRSCRGFIKEHVVRMQELRKIIEVNTKVGSARNEQLLRFKPVTKESVLPDGSSASALLLSCIRLGGALPELHLPLPGTEPEAFIIVCSSAPENKWIDVDLGIACQSMMLKATDMGLGGIMIGAFDKVKIKEALQLQYEPLLVLAIGKPAEHFQLLSINENDSHAYYRKDGVHYIPKVSIDDLII